jgi:hypothetical protein
MQGKIKSHKLKQKFYSPFEILDKVGKVAYKLNLPEGSMIHPIFYVSQLKRCMGKTTQPSL